MVYIRGLSERGVTPLGQKVQQKLTVDEDELLDSQLDALRNYIGLTKGRKGGLQGR